MFGEWHKTTRILLMGALAGVAAGLLGVAAAVTGDPGDPGGAQQEALVQPTGDSVTYSLEVTSSGPGMSFGAAADQVLKGMDGSSVTGLRLREASNSALEQSVPWVEIVTSEDRDSNGSSVHLLWQASLAEGALADLMRKDEKTTNQVVGGAIVRLPSGEEVDGGSSYVTAGQSFAAQIDSRSDDEVSQSVQQAIQKFGLKTDSITIYRPFGPAVAVVLTLPDESRIDWTIDSLREAINGDPRSYDGLYIEILGSGGQPLLKSGVGYRAGFGGLWFADGQDERFGVEHGGTPTLEGITETKTE